MLTSPSPLLTRLRRRCFAVAWVFALLMLAKAALATACLSDGLLVASTDGPPSSVAFAAAAPVADSDDGAACWHAGSGGCHCSCAHGTGLPVAATPVGAYAPRVDTPATVHTLPLAARPNTELRPPIA